MIKPETIQRIKDAANVVDVIGDFYDLRKRGVTYQCLCPFHTDRHIGSFMISEAKNCYTCFSCGAHGNSVDFLMQHEGMKLPEAIAWLGKKYGIEVEGSEKYEVRQCKPHEPAPPLPTLFLDYETMVKSRITTEGNVLYEWVTGLGWDSAQRARIDIAFRNYQVGVSKEDGRVIWWQIDEEGKVHTGKLMPYKKDGHRDHDGRTTWIHSLMFKNGFYDYGAWEVKTCLFGLHLLDAFQPKTVNIVESEKTAVICSIAFGNSMMQVWMATGGKSNLTREKLKPIIDRGIGIVLYPDHDAIEEWEERAKQINYTHLSVNKKYMLENWTKDDSEKADIADYIVRWVKPKKDTLLAEYPGLKTLDEVLDLEVIGIHKIDTAQPSMAVNLTTEKSNGNKETN